MYSSLFTSLFLIHSEIFIECLWYLFSSRQCSEYWDTLVIWQRSLPLTRDKWTTGFSFVLWMHAFEIQVHWFDSSKIKWRTYMTTLLSCWKQLLNPDRMHKTTIWDLWKSNINMQVGKNTRIQSTIKLITLNKVQSLRTQWFWKSRTQPKVTHNTRSHEILTCVGQDNQQMPTMCWQGYENYVMKILKQLL